ncbi:hypothetical protein HDU99_002246, partial [Rhizoclosmatium hyalinum]
MSISKRSSVVSQVSSARGGKEKDQDKSQDKSNHTHVKTQPSIPEQPITVVDVSTTSSTTEASPILEGGPMAGSLDFNWQSMWLTSVHQSKIIPFPGESAEAKLTQKQAVRSSTVHAGNKAAIPSMVSKVHTGINGDIPSMVSTPDFDVKRVT